MLTAVLASPAWTGSEDARHLPDDRAQAALPTSVLPFSLTEFFLRYYDRTMLRLNHTQTGFDPEQVWQRSDLAANVEAGKLAVSMNGNWQGAGCGVVFADERIKAGVYPAISAGRGTLRYRLNAPFRFATPPPDVW